MESYESDVAKIVSSSDAASVGIAVDTFCTC